MTKEVIVVAMHMLVERGLIEIDAPVARYWPEFAANGKATLPVRYVLDHRAGLPIVEDAWPGLAYDWMRMTAALAAQRPMWPPGSTLCYHATTHGFLMGEIIRRVTGKLPGDFVRDEICTPFGIDWHLGLKPDEEARAAEFVASPTWRTMNADPQGMFARAWRIFPETELFNSTEWRRGQVPSAGGHGNARALARLAGILACGGELNGQRLLKPSTLDAAVVEQWDGLELVGRHLRLGLGFLLNCAGTPMGSNPRAFGMFGAGGHVAIADPDRRIGFAYNMNRMGVDSGFGPRAIALIEAALGRR